MKVSARAAILVAFTMEIKTEPIAKPSHGFALLKELDLQRRTGTFCDCVIHVHVNPDQLFLAHKSVLAAFSPVFATLLPQHGSLIELNSPLLTPETLALLLEYMYTGKLPPESHEEPIVNAAFYLQMEQLQQALTCRMKQKEVTQTVQDQIKRKKGFTEDKSLNKTLLSSSYFPYGSNQPPATPSYEVVPVIRHSTGNAKFPLQSICLAKTLEQVSEANKDHQDNKLLLNSSHSKHDKAENSVNDMSKVVANEAEKFTIPDNIGQYEYSGPQTFTAVHSNNDNKDQCVHSAHTNSTHLSPEPDHLTNRCVSDGGSVQSFNSFETRKYVHVPVIFSDTISDKKSYKSTNNPENRGQTFIKQMTKSHKRRANLHLDNSIKTDTNDTVCENATPDLGVSHKINQHYAPSLEMLTVRQFALGEDSDCCEFSKLRKDYQGHLRYHCFPQSNESDSDETCPSPKKEAKDDSEFLETIDVAEILISTREELKSGSCSHSETRRFQCTVPECEKAFSQRGSLNRHMRTHLGIRPYSCPLCTMCFSRQYRVTEHMRVHQRSCDDPP
ncbi:telomere zinc finger-associated protein-like isoform X1 [Silurus meridionalis]|nr:telomere zinc finger-associated protein-like isoform X1 [Silurus meridionalis]